MSPHVSDHTVSDHYVEVDGLRLHYVASGEGAPVLLLHGWPTSSFLWRKVSVPIAAGNRVIALDLPGFGLSDKPLDASYSFRYYDRVLSGFLDALEIETTGLAVHDLGGPLGVYWACQHPERLSHLALLNTLIYPNPSWAVILFVAATRLPIVRSLLASSWGLKRALRFGVSDSRRLDAEALENIYAPFPDRDSRRALLKAGHGLSPKGFVEMAEKLPSLQVPVRIIYGAGDRILPDVARTMERAARDLPQAEVSVLADCGHFLQEERPEEIGSLLADFFGAKTAEA